MSNPLPYLIQNEYDHTRAIVISLPHSGTWVPSEMQQALLPTAILANTDWFLPALYAFLPAAGCTTITNQVNRYTADPNRPVVVAPVGRYQRTTVYERNTFGHPLYAAPLPLAVIHDRLARYYQPYRDALQQLLDEKIAQYGHVTLIDLHSFGAYPGRPGAPTADIVLGNRNDQASSSALRQTFATALTAQGFTVAQNTVFRGGDITAHYGAEPHISALQIELNYRCYIGPRQYKEEVLTRYDEPLFTAASRRLRAIEGLLDQIQ